MEQGLLLVTLKHHYLQKTLAYVNWSHPCDLSGGQWWVKKIQLKKTQQKQTDDHLNLVQSFQTHEY